MDIVSLQPPNGPTVTIDTCLTCGALWFDRQELARGSRRAVSRVHTNDEVDYRCPRCDVHLWAQKLGAEGHWASACIRCDGVFVDGESVDFALSLHPVAAREINAPRAGAAGTAVRRPRPRPRPVNAPVDYQKDINVEPCFECGERRNKVRWLATNVFEGWVCDACRDVLAPRGDTLSIADNLSLFVFGLMDDD